MATLQPYIIDLVTDRVKVHINDLKDFVSKNTGVLGDKVLMRVNKLVKKGVLNNLNGLISLPKEDTGVLRDFDRVERVGKIELFQKGKFVWMKSNLSEKESKDIIKDAIRKAPEIEKKLINEIRDLDKDLQKVSKIDILASYTTHFLKKPPEEKKFILLEILQNLIMNSPENEVDEYKFEDSDKIELKLEDIYKTLQSLCFSKPFAEYSENIERDIYSMLLMQYLDVRGNKFEVHSKKFDNLLFEEFEEFLRKKGFSVEDYYTTIKEIEDQVNGRFESIQKFKDLHKKFIDRVDSGEEIDLEKIQGIDDDEKEVMEKNLQNIGKKEFFEIELNDKINPKILEIISLEMGKNNWGGVFERGDIEKKPVIKNGDKYYCFLHFNLLENSTKIILSTFIKGEKNVYDNKKGEIIEKIAIAQFEKFFKEEEIHRSIYYKENKKKGQSNIEVDGLILSKGNLFLIEVKGKNKLNFEKLSIGNTFFNDMKANIKENIQSPFKQALRTYNYIKNNDACQFYDENNKKILEFQKSEIKNIYLIDITLEEYRNLSCNLNQLRLLDKEIAKDGVCPFIVNLFDLMIISDVLDIKNDMVEYIRERTELPKTDSVEAIDEIDYLGYFLDNGNLAIGISSDRVLLSGYDQKISYWFDYLAGVRGKVEKPKIKSKEADDQQSPSPNQPSSPYESAPSDE